MRSESVRILTLNAQNKPQFINELHEHLLRKFKVTCESDLPENYSRVQPWSLLRMIDEDILDIYQMVYVNEAFWGGAGGIIRLNELGRKIYQAGFRTISASHENVRRGLGTTSYLKIHCISAQIERAREQNCDKVVISFNEYNKRLFDLVQKYHFRRYDRKGRNDSYGNTADEGGGFRPISQPVVFNGVKQWILEMILL